MFFLENKCNLEKSSYERLKKSHKHNEYTPFFGDIIRATVPGNLVKKCFAHF